MFKAFFAYIENMKNYIHNFLRMGKERGTYVC